LLLLSLDKQYNPQDTNIMADPYNFTFDVQAYLKEQETAVVEAPEQGVMKRPVKDAEPVVENPTDSIKTRMANALKSVFPDSAALGAAPKGDTSAGRSKALNDWTVSTEPFMPRFLGDVPASMLLETPPVTTTVVGPDMDTLSMQDAQEQAAIRSASGITESLGRPAMPEGEAYSGVTLPSTDTVPDMYPTQGLMSPPAQDGVSGVDTTTAEAMATPETGAVSTSPRPKLRDEDNVVNKAILLNKKTTTLSKKGIKDQVRDLVGANDYAAGILGAFTKESGSNFSKLEENTNYSLSNAKGVFSSKKVADALKAVTPAVRDKINSGGRDKSFGEALMSHYGGGGKYHGRGLIHITHDYNYKAVGDRIGVDLVANPDLVKDPRYAVPAALAFLEINDYFNPDKPITKDRLHRIVNRHAGKAIKDSRWKAVEGFREDNTSVETSLRPKLSQKRDN